ncbi:SAM-dependent methyltransferase [Candidatus Woesearchaeota archaeon B3_Woes]|nr:MAG: SAM-dependent methyltransferase [Candidatus Woesearchaeota archaeon B3_Woes]
MAKILFKKEKKEFVKDLNKEITLSRQRFFYVFDTDKEFITEDGKIDKKDLKKKDGSTIKTNKDKEFIIFSTTFIDDFKRIKRKAQIITPKDIGIIIAETGINNKSKVVDAGTGSGALACYLAHICKEVTSYDIRDDSIETAKENKKFLDLKNLKIKKKSIFKGIDEKELDLIVLDIPDPWNAIKSCEKSLKIAGYLVVYLPSVSQISDFVNEIKKYNGFVYLKTTELIERHWKIDGRISRPKSGALGHTGFLSFVRRI